MNPEIAFYYKLLLQAGISDPYEAALEQALAQESPLSDLILSLSCCSSDLNETISCLHRYTLQFEIDLSRVADLIWEYLHKQYCTKQLSLTDARHFMYRIAACMDSWHEEPWYTMQVFELLWEDVVSGQISEDDLSQMMDDFLINRKLIGT